MEQESKKPVKAKEIVLDEVAVRIAIKVIKQFEGCSLRAYPDVASELSKTLHDHGILQKYIDGQLELPPYLAKLNGKPYTIGYGETQGVKAGDVWTQQEADSKLEDRVKGFMQELLKVSPKLALMSPSAIAATTSLCYNIGLGNYKTSTVCKKIAEGDKQAAGEAFLLWNKAKGVVLQGLVNRRKSEKDLFLSV